MHARTLFTSISFIVLFSSPARMLYAMDGENFSHGLIKRVLTTKAALGLGYCLNKSTLSPEIKTPLFISLFIIGTYGLEQNKRSCNTPRSDLLELAHTSTVLIGTQYLVTQLDLPKETKDRIYLALCATALWRLCKEDTDDSYDD